MRRRAVVALALAALVGAAACDPSTASGSAETVTVFAAASLTEAFTRIADEFELSEAGVRVVLSFGPSDGLAGQIREGAPADVFASASPKWMDDLAVNGPGLLGRSEFARNSLVVVVPSDNPAGIASLEDLARPGVKLVLAAAGVPAGDYARQILDQAGIAGAAAANVVSNETDVKAVLQKVVLGEADAGIVYRTDVTAADRPGVEVVDIADSVNVIATYPIAVVAVSEHRMAATRFVRFVLGPGQDTLRALGFLPAEPGSS